MDVREKLVYLVKNALRAYGKDLEKTVEPYEFIADFLIHSGVTVQEWISVKDRLPEDQEEVLVLTKSKTACGMRIRDIWQLTILSIAAGRRSPTGCQCQIHRKEINNDVIISRLMRSGR